MVAYCPEDDERDDLSGSRGMPRQFADSPCCVVVRRVRVLRQSDDGLAIWSATGHDALMELETLLLGRIDATGAAAGDGQ
jgi:hypothetical protein